MDAPVYCQAYTWPGDRISDQKSLDEVWAVVRKRLETQSLSQQDMLEVLKSGLLQRPTGRAMAGLFVEAMMRSIQPKGDLTFERLREIVEVICHLPPDRWGDAFGERLQFSGSAGRDSVVGFIQSQLELSRYQTDEMVVNGELLTDSQWECFQSTVRDCRSSIRPWREGRIESSLAKLEEYLEVRPSPQEAKSLLGELLQRVDKTKNTRQERFPARHQRAVLELWRNIKLESAPSLLTVWIDEVNSALNALGAVSAKDLGQALFSGVKSAGNAAATAVMSKAVAPASITVQVAAKPEGDSARGIGLETPVETKEEDAFSLLSALEEIEEKGEFYNHVGVDGPRAPKGLWATVVYVLNAVDTVRKLGVSAERPNRLPPINMPPRMHLHDAGAGPSSFSAQMNEPVANDTARSVPATAPAWFPGGRLTKTIVVPDARGFYEPMEQFARQVDQALVQAVRALTGWRPVDAVEQIHLQSLRETVDTLERLLSQASGAAPYVNPGSPYAPTVEAVAPAQFRFDLLLSGIGAWLQTSAGYLGTMGATALGAAAGAARQHPRAAATLALTALYGVVNEFHTLWLGALAGGSHFVQEDDRGLRGEILNEVETIFNDIPSVADAVRARIANAPHADTHQDRELVDDVAHLLEQPVPWNASITTGQLISRGIEQVETTYFLHHDRTSRDEDTPQQKNAGRSRRATDWTLETLSDTGALSSADKKLQEGVVTVLESDQNTRVPTLVGTLIHPSVELYKQAVNNKAVLEFFAEKGLELSTLKIHHDWVMGSFTENGTTSSRAFNLWDDSGWCKAAKSLLPILKLLDPDDLGLCHVSTDSNAIPRDVALRFYGVAPPSTIANAKSLASRLKTSGWPEFSTGKKTRLEKAVEQVKLTVDEFRNRELLVAALELVVEGKADNAIIPLAATIADFVSSSLLQATQKIRHHLNDFLALPAMNSLCQARKIDCKTFPFRLTEDKFQVFFENKWVDLTGDVSAQPVLKVELDKLIVQAKKTGNALYSSTSSDLLQIIRFNGFDNPKNAGEVRNIIRWLSTSIPPSPPLGNYGADLLANDPSFVTLNAAEKTTIVELCKTLQNESPSIIQALQTDLLAGTSVEYRQTNAHVLLTEAFDTDEADAWGQQMTEKLNWYGAAAGQTASVEQYHLLLCAAIKLSVDPDAPGKPGNIAGYDVYHASNRGRDLGEIRAEIENHLISTKGVSAQTAPLVAHLFLADVAPEFLVPGVGKTLLLGTSSWMTLRLGVAIAEASNPGCSRAMTAEQLMDLAVLDPVNEESRLLFQSIGVDIMVAWGVMNGVVRQSATGIYTPGDYESAGKMYARQRAEIAAALQNFSQPLSTRREMAIIELRTIFPNSSDSEIEAMKLWSKSVDASWNLQAIKGTTHDLVEVYMTGDLNVEDWWQPSRAGLTKAVWENRVRQLPDLGKKLAISVESHFKALSDAFITTTKQLFAELPLEDRQCLELGTVELFTLREETGKLKEDETSDDQAAVRGGYGTLMRCEYRGKVHYFEVFTALMTIVKRTDLPDVLPLNGVMKVEKVKISGGSPVNADVQRGTLLPFDFRAYSTGAAPKTSVRSPRLIIEKLGESFAPTPLVGYADETTYVPHTYFSPKVARIINSVIKDNFMQGQQSALLDKAKGVTPRDKQKQFWESLKNFAVQLIPFVGCIKDLSSGTRMGTINGAFGCYTDVVSSLFGLVGGAGKAVGVIKSVAPINFKAFELMKISAGSIVSVINPMSGFADLISGTARGVRRVGRMLVSRVFDVTQNGIARLQTAIDQLRCFLGGIAGEAGRKVVGWVSPDRIVVNGLHRGTNTTAIQSKNHWYGVGLDGVPFGPGLVGFAPRNP